jgi:PadR family transcriptional regulator, regulatory protein AphA
MGRAHSRGVNRYQGVKMNTRLNHYNDTLYIECLPGDGNLDSETRAIELITACAEDETQNLLIHAEALTPDFFNLRTGIAGAILQKFSNYHIRAALILSPEQANQGRFGEMVLEANRGNQFRVFISREQAETWLHQ